ncbi:MAG: hypothetical protein WBQ72_22765 [Terriglobales bacterium]
MVGAFYDGAQVAPGQYPGVMVVGDFNGDGRRDLAVERGWSCVG